MILFAANSLWYVAACVVVPLAWGAGVQWLFASWRARHPVSTTPTSLPTNLLDVEAEESNLP